MTLEDTPLASSKVVTTFAELDLAERFQCFLIAGLELAKREDPVAASCNDITFPCKFCTCLVEPAKLVEVVLPHDLPIVEIATTNQYEKEVVYLDANNRSHIEKKRVIRSVHSQWQYHVSTA